MSHGQATIGTVRHLAREGGANLTQINRKYSMKNTTSNEALATSTGFDLISAEALMQAEFPPISYVCEDLLPEGLTIFAGKPKVGKSWAMLEMAIRVALGEEWLKRSTSRGDVLYLALEDNHRRLQDRLNKLGVDPSNLSLLKLSIGEARLDTAFLEKIELWVAGCEIPRLLIIDTWAKVKPTSKASGDDYADDYASIAMLQELAGRHGISIVLVHHLRKSESEDIFDTVHGSTAITGAADSTIILHRTPDGTKLSGRGRDIAEFEYAVEFSKETYRWMMLGDADTARMSETNKKVLAATKEGHKSPKAISEVTGIDPANVRQSTRRMTKKGFLDKEAHGEYKPAA